MPIINVKRSGVQPAVRKVPTATCAVVLPMSLDRVGKELGAEDEQPTKLESAQDAFTKFQPGLKFKARAGAEQTEFVADLQFENLSDFAPENILRHHGTKDENNEMVYRRNDLADLKNGINRLQNLKRELNLPAFRRAWADPEQRAEIVKALGELRDEMAKLAPPKQGGTQ